MLASVPEERRRECWWIVLQDGTAVAGDGGGALALFAEMQLTQPLGRLLRVLRLSPVFDTLDRLLARYRAALGRFVPEGPAPRRYP